MRVAKGIGPITRLPKGIASLPGLPVTETGTARIMESTQVTQQTSTTLPLRSELVHGAPAPEALRRTTFRGPLQWALEGPGWGIVRPVVDVVLLYAAVIAAMGGVSEATHPRPLRAPLLLLPVIVTLLFYLRGLYRNRLRALVLDGVVPVLAAVSVATMAVSMFGLYVNGHAPPQWEGIRAWGFGLLAVCLGRVLLGLTQRWARASRLVGKPVLILGAGMVGAQVARRLENHPEYGLSPVGFLDEDPPSVAEVGGRPLPVLGSVEELDETVASTGVKSLIVAFSSATDARVSRLIQHCQELGVEVSVVPRMFDTINDRVRYDTVGGLPLMTFCAVDPKGLQFAAKHALDRVLAALLLVVISPVILLDRARGAPHLGRARCCSASAASGATGPCSTSTSSARCTSTRPRRLQATKTPRRSTSCSTATRPPAGSRATTDGRRSAGCCAASRWTSCRSCSTCCAAR